MLHDARYNQRHRARQHAAHTAQALPDEVGHRVNVVEVAEVRHEQHRAEAADQRAEEHRDEQDQAVPLAADGGLTVVEEYQHPHSENLRTAGTE